MTPSEPEHELDQCFILKREYNELNVENIGYGDIQVKYGIKGETRYFDLPNMTSIGIIGNMDLSLLNGKIPVKSVIDSGTLTLHYNHGARITMMPAIRCLDGERLLIEFESDTWDNDWGWN